jgi:hypothetical protein
MSLPLITIPPASPYRFADHPSDPTLLIVVDVDGNPLSGKKIVVGDAVVSGDITHASIGKGPVVMSPSGTNFRVHINDDGSVTSEPA